MNVRSTFSLKTISAAAIACAAVLYSCKKDTESPLSSSDSQNVNSESVSESNINETSDVTTAIVSNVNDTQLGAARVESSITGEAIDGRLKGATITISGEGGKSNPHGTITIDFKTGTTDAYGVVRKGIIKITYAGRRWANGSTRVISYSGYSRNNVQFDDNMTFTLTNTSTDSTGTTFKFHHVLANGKLTFPGGTTITRQANYDLTVDFVAKTLTVSANANATHSASGTTRAGKDYTTDITTPIVFKEDCVTSKVYMPSSGVKSITAGAITYTIDYGSGTCDNTVVITIAGKSVTITVSADGN